MNLRSFELGDLDLCIDMYLDFVNALEHGDQDPWTENAVAERLKGILENPDFAGFALEDEGKVKGFLLGVFTHLRDGEGYEVLELCCAQGVNIQATAARMLEQCLPLLKERHITRVTAFSTELWDAGFFEAHGFGENRGVRLFEKPLR